MTTPGGREGIDSAKVSKPKVLWHWTNQSNRKCLGRRNLIALPNKGSVPGPRLCFCQAEDWTNIVFFRGSTCDLCMGVERYGLT